jgi:hypothetical protein
MTDFILSGRLTAESEFHNVPSGVNGACGPESIAASLRALHQSDVYTVAKVFSDIHSWGLCASNGVMDLNQIIEACKKYGLIVAASSPSHSLTDFAAGYFKPSPKAACIFYYGNGQALVDYISHDGMDASNLHGHFNTAVGFNDGTGISQRIGRTLPIGFWVADGDNNIQNPIVNGARVHMGLNTNLVYYTESDLGQAGLGWVLAVSLPVTPTTTKTISVNLRLPYSLDEIAKSSTNDVAWLKSWNQHLSSLPGYSNTTLPLPANTPVNIPYR